MTTATANAVFSPIPSLDRMTAVVVSSDSTGGTATAKGLAMGRGGATPGDLGLDRGRLESAGFDAAVGSTLVVATADGPTVVVVGIGDPDSLSAAGVRDAAAAFARAAGSHTHLAFSLAGLDSVSPDAAAQAVVEGVLLARYRYDALRTAPKGAAVSELTLTAAPEHAQAAREGAERGQVLAAVTQLARDLANTPHSHLNATGLADVAVALGAERGFEVEVFDKAALLELGCGGLLGANAGSAEPPQMIKLTYRPNASGSGARLSLVGKGLMFRSDVLDRARPCPANRDDGGTPICVRPIERHP